MQKTAGGDNVHDDGLHHHCGSRDSERCRHAEGGLGDGHDPRRCRGHADDGTLRTALIAIVLMVFTFNLCVGMTAGFVAFPILKLLYGRWREVGGEMWFLGLLSLRFFLFGSHWCAFQEENELIPALGE
jgi:hypothetical protein